MTMTTPEASSSSPDAEAIWRSDDGLFQYRLERTGPAADDDGMVPHDIRLYGPGLPDAGVLYRGFPSRASAQLFVHVHAASSDLSDFVLLRTSRAMHQWARHTHHDLPVNEVESLIEHGGTLP